jgi:acetyltransferase-like isoleucine patch superfamily enzyme
VERRITFSTRNRARLRPGEYLGGLPNALIEPYTRFGAGNTLFTCGAFSYTRSALPTGVVVGRYCSLGANLSILGRDHPLERFSSSPFTYHAGIFGDALTDIGGAFRPVRRTRSAPMPTFGNDVWIGQDVSLARGITIGDGAVIAAGAVVTKSVPPYEIWGGVPARRIRLRFEEAIVERLVALRWWRFAFPSFTGVQADAPIADAVSWLEDRIAQGLEPFAPEPLKFADLVRFGAPTEQGDDEGQDV